MTMLKIPRSVDQPVTALIVICLILATTAFFKYDELPKPTEILRPLYGQPQQTDTEAEPFVYAYDDLRLNITPKFDYDLNGLVVSIIDHHEKSAFDVNTFHFSKDLCVLWGGNLAKDDYRKAKYWSYNYMCLRSFPDGETITMNESEISNNHLLPATHSVDDALREVRVGDQIHFSGYLIDYTEPGQDWKVESSISRDDINHPFSKKNKGNCEVVFVKRLEILQIGAPFWRYSLIISLIVLVIAVIAKFMLMNQVYDDYEEDFNRRTKR